MHAFLFQAERNGRDWAEATVVLPGIDVPRDVRVRLFQRRAPHGPRHVLIELQVPISGRHLGSAHSQDAEHYGQVGLRSIQ